MSRTVDTKRGKKTKQIIYINERKKNCLKFCKEFKHKLCPFFLNTRKGQQIWDFEVLKVFKTFFKGFIKKNQFCLVRMSLPPTVCIMLSLFCLCIYTKKKTFFKIVAKYLNKYLLNMLKHIKHIKN